MLDVESDPDLRHMALGCYNGVRSGYENQGIGGRPLRFLVKQKHATRGGSFAKMRLCAWMYIRRQETKHVIDAVRIANRKLVSKGGSKGYGNQGFGKKGGPCAAPSAALTRMGPLEQKQLEELLAENPIYHAVIRGNDPNFMPRGGGGQDVVTNFFVTGINEMYDLFAEKIDNIFAAEEFGETPVEAFRSFMADVGFVQLLEDFFKIGDQTTERNLKLVGRLNGGGCLLHRAIKEDQVEFVRELLELYTPELTFEKPWLRLAEPFLVAGKYRLSAFHRAVYDGRPECLELLMQYAERCGKLDDLRELRNLEDKKWQHENDDKEGMTVLELAESTGNSACYNVVARFFGMPLKHDAVDNQPREGAFLDLLLPRVEVTVLHGHGQRSVQKYELPNSGQLSWPELAGILSAFLPRALGEVAGGFVSGANAITGQSPTGAAKMCARQVDVAIHNAAITGLPMSLADAATLMSLPFEACEQVNTELLTEASRKLQLFRFTFRACYVQAEVPQTVLTFLRPLISEDVASHLAPLVDRAGHVRYEFGFLPWSRRIGPNIFPAWVADAVTANREQGLEGHAASMMTACHELVAEYYSRTVLQGHVERNIDFWSAGKLMMNRVLPDETKWLWLAAPNAKAPVMFLLKHYRKRMLSEVPVETTLATNADATVDFAAGGGANGVDAVPLRDEADHEFHTSVELLSHALTVFNVFWDNTRLIFEKPENPADNLEPHAIFYVEFMLRAWFVGLGSLEGEDFAAVWRDRFVKFADMPDAAQLDADIFAEVCGLLRVAMDKAVSSILRMDGMLNIAFQKMRAKPAAFFGFEPLQHSTVRDYANFVVWMRSLIPEELLNKHLSITRKQFRKLEEYY